MFYENRISNTRIKLHEYHNMCELKFIHILIYIVYPVQYVKVIYRCVYCFSITYLILVIIYDTISAHI